MSIWDGVKGQSQVLGCLQTLVDSNRLSHAYMLLGPSGVGKRRVAKTVAAALTCKNAGCGDCRECSEAVSGSHRNILMIEPSGRQIRIEQIRETQRWLSIDPGRNTWRVVIIDPAESMGSAAANALLKSLEEPPPNVVFFLLVEVDGALPATVRSRCQLLRMNLLPDKTIEEILIGEGASLEDAKRWAPTAAGHADRAVALFRDDEAKEWRETFFTQLASLGSSSAARDRLVELSTEYISDRASKAESDVLDLAAEAEEFLKGARGSGLKAQIKENSSRAKDRASSEAAVEICDLVGAWYRDMAVFAESADVSTLRNQDVAGLVQGAASNSADSAGALMAVAEASGILGYNVRETEIFESLFLRLSHLRR